MKILVCCGLESECIVLSSLFVFLPEGCESDWCIFGGRGYSVRGVGFGFKESFYLFCVVFLTWWDD